MLVVGHRLFDFFILNLSFWISFTFMKKKNHFNLYYFRFLHFLFLVGFNNGKIYMCFAKFTKYMFIRHFKLMWHFFNESKILVAYTYPIISNSFNKSIKLPTTNYIPNTLTDKIAHSLVFTIFFSYLQVFFHIFF